MLNVASDPVLADLLAKYDANGGVLDYVFLEVTSGGSPYDVHRAAALSGIAEIDSRLERRKLRCRLCWDAEKLKGERVNLATFWGTNDVEMRRLQVIPNVDGYKSAFFQPPHSLGKTVGDMVTLFENINKFLLGDEPQITEIFSWSTDWSNYFDAGHEWWGAYFWTIRQPDSLRFGVVGASTTD